MAKIQKNELILHVNYGIKYTRKKNFANSHKY